MKRIFVLAFLLLAGMAQADTTSTPIKLGTYTLIRSATVVKTGFATIDLCYAAGEVDWAERNKGSLVTASMDYRCRQDSRFSVIYTPPTPIPPNPFPNGETQTVQCTAPQTGSWTQTRTYTWNGTAWVAGAWTPATAPAGACTTPPPPTTACGPTNLAVKIDCAKMPAASWQGWDKPMFTTNMIYPSAGDGSGAFRTTCKWSHMAFDDPLLYPNQPGASHLHTFFGNALTNAASTTTSISTTGNSTCNGGTINRTGYWVPTMIDTLDGRPIGANNDQYVGSQFYYKTGYTLPVAQIKPAPAGLRMITGDSKGNPTNPSRVASYRCIKNGGATQADIGTAQSTIPYCQVSGYTIMRMSITFPQCWDGVNLDSPDHKSHMANAVYTTGNQLGYCPTTHPVAIPEISFEVEYPVRSTDDTRRWRLASDNYDITQPAGYSSHGDWMMGWDATIMQTFVSKCLNTAKNCGSTLIGDGREMVVVP